MRLKFQSIILCGSFLCLGAIAFAQDDAADKTEKSATAEKKPAPVKISGVFEAIEDAPLSAGTKHVSSLIVKKVLPHGSTVNKGQPVIWFETEKPDKQLKDAERALRLAELTMADDEFAYEQFVETQTLDRTAANRTRAAAQERFDNFTGYDHERQIASARFSLKSSRASLANVQEELKQLEQMYKEDDLTEESEEIVLKRAKQSVESAEFRFESAKIQTERSLTQSIPRSVADQDDKLARSQLAYAKTIRDLESARKRRDIEMTQKREKLKKQVKDLKQLRAERNSLVIRSPLAGIFYHGAVNRGKVSDKPSSLKPEATATSKQVLGTVVNPDRLQVRLDVTEVLLRRVKAGATAKISPAVDNDTQVKGKVKSIGSTPYVNGKFDCIVTVGKLHGLQIVPGMSCQVEIAEGKSK